MIAETTEEFIARKTKEFENKPVLIPMKDIGRLGKHFFIREAFTFLPQSNIDGKVFIIERLRRDSSEGQLAHDYSKRRNDIEYRIGYFIVSQYGRTKGKWVWGQFCPLIPHQDLASLLDKARKEGTIK